MPNLAKTPVRYEVGSIQTLIDMADSSEGIIILPRLATERLNPQQQAKLRAFAPPKPAREVSLITVQDFPRKKTVAAFKGNYFGGGARPSDN